MPWGYAVLQSSKFNHRALCIDVAQQTDATRAEPREDLELHLDQKWSCRSFNWLKFFHTFFWGGYDLKQCSSEIELDQNN